MIRITFPIFLAVTISKWDFDQESAVKGNESLYEDLAELSRTSTENNNINNEWVLITEYENISMAI